MTNTDQLAERFSQDTNAHQLTICHNADLYRHLRFRNPKHSMYWFDLITIPGTLIFQGDGESFVFSRIDDMFQFFRNPGIINPGYWSEKLTSTKGTIMRYDEDLFRAWVQETAAEAQRNNPTLNALGAAVQSEILDSIDLDISFVHGAHQALSNFSFYKVESERYNYQKAPDFVFQDYKETDFQNYDWWFLWACHAIVWGIAKYDQNNPTGGQE